MTESHLSRLSQSKHDLGFARKIAEASDKSPYVWAVSYLALPKGVVWTFDDRAWQIDILEDLHPRIVVEKPTQIGLTTVSTVKGLWFISKLKSRAMYTLPRRDDVTDYVATTLDPLIEASEYLSVMLGRTNNTRMKRLGDSFYHVMEASVTPRMLPVDILINDEVDMSDQDNMGQFVARLDASKYQYHYQFSTPTVSGYGIDAEYERSDRREWVVTCSRCSHEQILDWENHLIRDSGREPFLACLSCSQQIRNEDIVGGRWIVTNPQSSIHGYHVSHLMLPYTRPLKMLVEEEKVMDRKTFYNLRLGRPWTPIGGSMPSTLFRDHAFRSGHEMVMHPEKGYRYYLGADQGNEVHVVVGRVAQGSDKLEIVYAEHIKPRGGEDQFERLAAIMRMFNIDFGLCDANPNRQSIYNLCKEMHGSLGAADIGAHSYPFKWHGFNGASAYKLVVNRTDMLDGLRDDIATEKISLWGDWDNRPYIAKEIIRQCGNLKRDTEARKLQAGGETIVGVWRKTGDDHFAFAFSLCRLAAVIAPNISSFDFAVVGKGDSDDGEVKREEVVKSSVWEDTYYYVDESGGRRPAPGWFH